MRRAADLRFISIHALAKRATSIKAGDAKGVAISIHALAKRATTKGQVIANDYDISIHALAKRATYSKCPQLYNT